MAYQEPDLPVATQPVSVSAFGAKVRNSIMWLKDQVDALLAAPSSNITNRQGGSATDWNTSGTTNYPVTNSMVQSGAYQETLSTVPGKSGQIITFPVAFSGKPAVMTSIEHVSGARYGIVSSVEDVSATQFTIYAGTEVSSGWNDVVIVHWEAKGKSA